jgi:nitrite reductase/ring-hydroxylating ferredoxin subunit
MFVYVAFHRGGPYDAPDRTSIFVSLVGVLLLGGSGWLGATLIYRNQIGVDRRYANANTFKERTIESFERPACNQSELGEGHIMLVHVGSERIAVGRCSEGVFAISDRCTHKGGPLSDGAVIGCAVQCPWHGSQFDVHTGRVIAGPANHQVKTYDVEVRAGEVFIKAKGIVSPERAA